MLPPDPKKLLPHKAADNPPDHGALPASLPLEGDGGAPAAPPPALSAMPGLGNLLHAFRRCWLWAVPLALLGGAVGAAAGYFLVPGQYVSSVVFRIQSRPMHGALENEDNITNIQRAQVASLKSYEVMSETIHRSGVADRYGVHYTHQSLARKLTTNFNEGPELMFVQLGGDNPEAVAAVLTTLSEVYPQKIHTADEARVKLRIAQLRRRLEIDPDKRDGKTPTLAEQLRDKRIELRKAEKEHGLDDVNTLATKYQHALARLHATQQTRSDKHLQRLGLEAELASREKRLNSPMPVFVSDAEAEESIQNKREYQTLMNKLDLAREHRAWVRDKTEGERQARMLASVQGEIARLNVQRREMIAEARERLVARARAVALVAERKAISKLRDDIEQIKKQELSLDAEARRWALEVENYKSGGPRVPPEVEALRDQVKQLEKEAGRVGDDLAALEGSLPITPRIAIQAAPFVPNELDLSRTIKVAGALGVLSFLGVLAGLCMLEASRRRIYSSDDLNQGLGLRVVGTLPRLPAGARHKSASVQSLGGLDARYGLTEAVDALRTVLMHSPRVDGARVVVVTSAIGGEGKTTLASHLAASLARAWRKTLLIDGDLRKPAAHQQFDLPLEPGLSEALRGEIEYDDTIKPTMTSRLWLMPAGKVDAHSLQALAQEGLASVFERLKEQYDFIILDTSPVLPVPDALLLAQQADTVLLSVLRDHSRLPAVYAAQQKLETLGIRVLGSVIIGEKTETYGHAVPYPQG